MKELPVKYKRHIFVCVNERPEGECCTKKHSIEILLALRNHVNSSGLMHKYNITKTKCLGHCSQGPTIAIYPEGRFFVNVGLDDIQQIIDEFLQ